MLIMEAGSQLTLKGPGGFVDISASGIAIQGTSVLINCGGSAGSGTACKPASAEDAAEASPKEPSIADDSKPGQKSAPPAMPGLPPISSAATKATIAAPPTPQAPKKKLSWIKFKVVDDKTGKPVSGATLKVKLPDKTVKEFTTNEEGMIEIDGIDPGSCDVTCDIKNARLSDSYDFVRRE
jgi:hypothetical protein